MGLFQQTHTRRHETFDFMGINERNTRKADFVCRKPYWRLVKTLCIPAKIKTLQ